MSQLKHIKKIASLVLIFSLVLFLVSCTKSTKVPYGDIDDSTYLTLGNNITVTEKELYDAYRKQGATTLASMFDEILFEEQIELVQKLLGDSALTDADEAVFTREELREELNNLILESMFSTTDVETIKLFGSLRTQVAVERFVDSVFTLNNSINREELFEDLLDHVNTSLETEEDFKFFEFDELLGNYELRLAQKIYAKEILLVDVDRDEEDNTDFIKELDVINYYKNNVRNRHDVDVFIFNFRHVSEATAVLRDLVIEHEDGTIEKYGSVKADASGNWYFIPDIRTPEVFDDLSHPDYTHVRDILNNLDIAFDTPISDRDFYRFYSSYTPNSNRLPSAGRADIRIPAEDILEFFIVAYNMVNGNRPVDLEFYRENGTLQYLDGSEFNTLYNYEDLTALGTSLRSYIYDSLYVDEEDKKAYSSLRASGNLRYLIFKLEDHAETDLIAEEKDEDDNDQWIEDLTEENLANIAEWRTEIAESRLTTSYVSRKVNELLEDTEIDIYDNILRSFYEDAYGYEGTTKNNDGNVIATINGTDISPRDLFNQMDKAFGVSLALDLATNKYLLSTKDDHLSSDDIKGFEKDFKDLINAFSNDEFAQAGYPSSVGRAKFLLSVFGAENNQEAIELGFIIPELRSNFSTDYESHYDNFYEKLATLTNRHYEEYKGVTVSHLLVYFDENGDGTPDNPQEYLEKLTEARRTEILEGILELMIGNEGIYENLASDVDFSDVKGGLTLLASEVNNAGRVPLNNNTRNTWTEFAKLGINLKFEDLGSQITNTSNFITGSSTLDTVFYDRAMALHDAIINQFDEAKTGLEFLDFYPYNSLILEGNTDEEGNQEDVMNQELTTDILENVLMSDFGFHFILVTGVDAKLDFDYDGENDVNENYQFELDDKTYNIYNDDAAISASQIEYYIVGNEQESGASMPTSVSRAFTKHFTPIFDRYNTNSYMQREIFFKALDEIGVTLHKSDANAFELIREVNKRQFFDYLNERPNLEFDANYEALYGDWFEILEG